jgi:hypothetical protein
MLVTNFAASTRASAAACPVAAYTAVLSAKVAAPDPVRDTT